MINGLLSMRITSPYERFKYAIENFIYGGWYNCDLFLVPLNLYTSVYVWLDNDFSLKHLAEC